MVNGSLLMVNSSSVNLSAGSPTPHRSLRVDRFDTLAGGVIVGLLLAIGVVIAHGDHASGAVAIPPGIIYVGPIDALTQNLWRVAPDGSGSPQQLTNVAHGILDFDVSREGLVAYSDQTAQGGTKLMQYDPATGKSSVLYDCPDATCMEPAWRPDGKAIAFDHATLNLGTNLPPGAPRVWVYDLTTGQTTALFTDGQKLGYMARWSPDGKRLAVFDAGSAGIVIHDFTTNSDLFISAIQGQVGTFSPDSKALWFPKIVTVDGGQYVTHLVIVDISSDPPLQHDLVPDELAIDDADPIWLPDGKSLLLLRVPSGRLDTQERQIYRVDVASGTATAVLDEPGFTHSNLSLNAAGDELVYQKLELGTAVTRPEIWTLDLKTSAKRKLADDGNIPRWLP
jgi:Tol biopolymer transport system component